MADVHEREHLSGIADNSLYAAGMNTRMIRYSFQVFSRFIRGSSVLELGPAEGIMTDLLATLGKPLTVVEGAPQFCRQLQARHPAVRVVNALFEDYDPEARFDSIVMGHVLEHVQDPVAILRRASGWLAPGGRILAAVPNARSIHRQAAVIMGLLSAEDALNEMDLHHGHRRVFNPETFRQAFLGAGLTIEVFGGYWLKPLSNRQLEESWTDSMVDAFMQLGERYPDIAGELYVVAVSST
jgi:2-polyprenyl-3-methyl-5-hydroxy-6-metoxy-1,4-benzoquinol methylase